MNASRIGTDEPAEHSHERALSGAVLADHGPNLARSAFEGDSMERRHRAIALRYVLETNLRTHRANLPCHSDRNPLQCQDVWIRKVPFMKPIALVAAVALVLVLVVAPSTGHGQGATAVARPKNINPAIFKPTEPAFSKKNILGQAAKLSATQLAKMNLFVHGLLTPRNPASENAGLFLERPAQYDPLRDLAEFYGNQGNPAARFYTMFLDRPYLVDFTVDNRSGNQMEFDMDFGAAASATGVGEGFFSETNQIVKLMPGKQHATFVVYPKKSTWYWVAMKSRKTSGLWNVVSAEITYLK